MTKLEKSAAARGFKEIAEYSWWFNVDARMGFSRDSARDADRHAEAVIAPERQRGLDIFDRRDWRQTTSATGAIKV